MMIQMSAISLHKSVLNLVWTHKQLKGSYIMIIWYWYSINGCYHLRILLHYIAAILSGIQGSVEQQYLIGLRVIVLLQLPNMDYFCPKRKLIWGGLPKKICRFSWNDSYW